MSWRTVVVSSRSKLELKNNYLVIRGETVKRVFLDEISVLLIENTGSAVTVSLLEALWSRKIAVIFCDKRRTPGAQLIPYYNCHNTSMKIHSQMQWRKSTKLAVWTCIIKEKISNQAKVLYKNGYEKQGDLLFQYIDELKIGDTSNREGHAAKVYFNSLFGNDFSRDDDCFINSALNYGYSIILSTVAREIVANGYLTQIGLFHKNVFNELNFASDLMEPFRPIIDSVVLSMVDDNENSFLEHEDKISILSVLNCRVRIGHESNTLLNAISIYVKSVMNALEEENPSLIEFYLYEF